MQQMKQSFQEFNEKISRILFIQEEQNQKIQEQHDHLVNLSSKCEKEYVKIKKVNSCHEESIKEIFSKLEAHNIMTVYVRKF